MTSYKCECSATVPAGKNRCPACKAWVWRSATAKDESIAYDEILSADDFRIKTGLIDECLGGGVVIGDVILVGGTPGAGKSTLLLQTSEILAAQGEVNYIAAEEDLKAIKARGVRLGISGANLRFIPAMGGVADIGELLMTRKPKTIILDSLDGLVGHDHDSEIKTLEVIKKYTVMLQSVAIVISQVNKDEDFTGLMAKQHAVDVLLKMYPNEDVRTENGEPVRVLETIKNRHGRAYVEQHYEMGERGLDEINRVEE